MNTDGRPPLPSPTAGDCRNCGQPIPPGAAFCPNCGASRATGQVGKATSVWRLLGASILGCLGLMAGGLGACLAIVAGFDRSGLDAAFFGFILLCLAIGAAFIFGFVKLIKP